MLKLELYQHLLVLLLLRGSFVAVAVAPGYLCCLKVSRFNVVDAFVKRLRSFIFVSHLGASLGRQPAKQMARILNLLAKLALQLHGRPVVHLRALVLAMSIHAPPTLHQHGSGEPTGRVADGKVEAHTERPPSGQANNGASWLIIDQVTTKLFELPTETWTRRKEHS